MRTMLRARKKQAALTGGARRYCAVAAAVVGSAVVGGLASSSAAGRASDASERATEANAYQGEIAKEQYSDYKEIYQPLEKQMVADVAGYDSQAAYDKAAAGAQSTVSTQLGLAKDRLARTPGLDPSSPAAMAANAGLELKGAALGAAEQNKARDAITDKAYARKLDAVGLGKGLVTSASAGLASSAQTAQQIANSQSASANATASGAGSLVSGVVGGLSKINWGATKTAEPTYSVSDNLGTTSGMEALA